MRALWRHGLWVTVLLTISASIAIDRGDPSWAGTLLWLGSIGAAVGTGVAHDWGRGVWPRIAHHVGWRRADTVLIVALTVVAVAVRVYRLDAFLPAMHGDEGEMGLLARRALRGPADGMVPLPVFTTGFLDHPTLFHYLQAASLWVFGDSVTGLKMLSVVFGALCVPPVYVTGRLGWGRPAAVTAGALLAVSHLHIHFSRIALNNIESVWFMVSAMALVTAAAVHAHSFRDAGQRPRPPLTIYVLLGVLVGLSQYFYYGSRLLAVVALPILLLLVADRLARWRDLGATLAAGVVPFLPLLRRYLDDVPAFVNRTKGVNAFSATGIAAALGPDATWPDDLPRLAWSQVRRNVGFFLTGPDQSSFYARTFPAFDTVTVVLCWLGIVVVAVQAARRRPLVSVPARALLVWFVGGVVLGGVLTIDSPNAPRLLMAVPAVFVLAGAAVQYAHDRIAQRWPERGTRALLGVLVVGAVLTARTNMDRYFDDYPREQATGWVVELAFALRDGSTSHEVLLLGEPVIRVNHGVIAFITDGAPVRDLASMEALDDELAAAAASHSDLLLVALPHRADEFAQIVRDHPGGTATEHHDARDDRVLWMTYELAAP